MSNIVLWPPITYIPGIKAYEPIPIMGLFKNTSIEIKFKTTLPPEVSLKLVFDP